MDKIEKDESLFPFKCCFCSKSFKTEKYLNFHIEGSHMSISFSCEICLKGFANRETLKRHIGVVHEIRKNFECQQVKIEKLKKVLGTKTS